MKTFRRKYYEIETEKLKGGKEVRFALLSDLHGVTFGADNRLLLDAVMEEKADAVLVVGDMFVRSQLSTMDPARIMLAELAEQIPVYYSLGNHEYVLLDGSSAKEAYLEYERYLTDCGVCFLHNEHTCMEIRGTDFIFYGLELPMEYYKKPKSPRLSISELDRFLGTPHMDGIHILLAHNPKYGSTYLSWGADLIVSGHYHGGVVRLSENRGLTCPQYLLFPPYCCGEFQRAGRHMIVSAGLGEHTIPIRIHNPRELLIITVKPPKASEKKERK